MNEDSMKTVCVCRDRVRWMGLTCFFLETREASQSDTSNLDKTAKKRQKRKMSMMSGQRDIRDYVLPEKMLGSEVIGECKPVPPIVIYME